MEHMTTTLKRVDMLPRCFKFIPDTFVMFPGLPMPFKVAYAVISIDNLRFYPFLSVVRQFDGFLKTSWTCSAEKKREVDTKYAPKLNKKNGVCVVCSVATGLQSTESTVYSLQSTVYSLQSLRSTVYRLTVDCRL